MKEYAEDIFAKLETAIAEWDTQLTSAQRDLTRHLADVKQRLDTLADHVSAEKARANATPTTQKLEALQQTLADRDLALEAERKRVAELERTLHERDTALATGRTRTKELEHAVDQLRGEIETMRAEIGRAETAAEAGRRSQQSAEELELQLRAERDRANALANEVEHALRGRAEAERQIEALRSQVDTLRRANASLADKNAPRPPQQEAEEIALAATDQQGQRRKMGEILVAAGVITLDQLEGALEEQERMPRTRLGHILVELGYADEEVVARALSSQLGLPFMRLDQETVEKKAVPLISERLARFHDVFPVALRGQRLVLAMTNPLDLIAIEDIELTTGKTIEPAVATPSDVETAIARFYA